MHLSPSPGFLLPRVAVAVTLFSAAAFLAFVSFAGTASSSRSSSSVANAAPPPFTAAENKVTVGGVTLTAKMFASAGKVKPGETFPIVLIYQAGETPSLGGTATVTLHSSSTFVNSTPAPASGTGAAGSPLVYNIPALAPNATGQISIEARAKDLTQDPEIMWKDISADVTLAADGQGPAAARTRGPKVTTLETAVYGERPFPVVMVQYQDVKHCTDEGFPFPECTGNHTAAGLDEAMNSRTSGKSVWQLYQDMSFGQLFPDARVSPLPNSPNTPFAATPNYPYKWSKPSPQGACTGTTTAPTGSGAPPYINRIEGGWYQLPGTQSYYGGDSAGHGAVGQEAQQGLLAGIDDACGPTGKIAYDAAAIADPDIDYNDFDTDKDGLVDFFNLVFAGDGGNLSVTPTGLNNVWPHSSDLRQYFKDANGQTGYVSNDQFRNRLNQPMYFTDATRKEMTTTQTDFPVYVRVGQYNVNPESALDSVSVIAHEYGHSLGLPDFYSTGSRTTFGSWELMGSDHFQYMTVFSRQEMGWVVPRPVTSGQLTMIDSKFDTGEIHWNRPDGTPYTLSGPGIHNADVYRLGLPPRILIEEVPSGVHAWYSQAGNDFGCPNDGGGHNLDIFLPELKETASAGAITLKMKHLYEIEWDYDYGFVMVSDDNGATWKSLPSKKGSTITSAYNPHQNQCHGSYGNGITGVSDGQPNSPTNPNRIDDAYPPAKFVDDEFDLSAYKGKTIILRFSYSTDPGLAKRGWFIDDVEITADNNVVYKSDFEESVEDTKLFPKGWVRVSSAEGSPADHAYYLELRTRTSNDFDSKGQSDRGAPGWEGGVSMIYTDEAHGYGNFGTDDPPAQTPVDSAPEPGNASPNLNDAAFTLARPEFNGCTHIDNYDAEPGSGSSVLWKLPPHLNFIVTGINGLTAEAGLPATPASATLITEVYPNCEITLAPPELSIGAGYEDPDTDGVYQLTWTRPLGAVAPDVLQVATSCGPTSVDDASEPLVTGDNSKWNGTPQWMTQVNPDTGSTAYYIPNGAEQDDSLVSKKPFEIPASFGATLTFTTRQSLEAGYDFGNVEASADNGTTWKTMAAYSGPGELPDEVFSGTRTVDLSEFSGQSILIRFRLTSDLYNFGQPAGWWIDNIAFTVSDWRDVTSTSATSFEERKPGGSYCYRVRTTYPFGTITRASGFSNVVNVTVAEGVVPPLPAGPAAQLLNISTRVRVQGGDKIGIGGFIITGSVPKRVLLRGIGPSLSADGKPLAGRLPDPVIELYDSNGVFITSNDNWKDSPDRGEIESSGLAPSNDAEAAIARTLPPGAYTAMVFGKDQSEGIALVEAYDRDEGGDSEMANISTRGSVETGDNVLIGGFIAGARTGATNVIVRAIGPSLSSKGVPDALQDPVIELVDANGQVLDASDDWKGSADQAEVSARGLAPADDREAAVFQALAPGNYTAIVRGKESTTGVGLVEIYNVQ